MTNRKRIKKYIVNRIDEFLCEHKNGCGCKKCKRGPNGNNGPTGIAGPVGITVGPTGDTGPTGPVSPIPNGLNTTIPTNILGTNLDWSINGTSDFITNGSLAGGIYTVPVTGIYNVRASLTGLGTLLEPLLNYEILVNGANVAQHSTSLAGGVLTAFTANQTTFGTYLYLQAGDQVTVILNPLSILTAALAPQTWFTVVEVSSQ